MFKSVPEEYFIKYSSSEGTDIGTAEEDYLTKYSSGTLLTTSNSEQHTDQAQSLSEDSVHGS